MGGGVGEGAPLCQPQGMEGWGTPLAAGLGGGHKEKGRGVPGGCSRCLAPPGPPAFARAFSYTKRYCQDICFDNLYITTYFRQIDARRRKQVRGGRRGGGRPPPLPVRGSWRAALSRPAPPSPEQADAAAPAPGRGLGRHLPVPLGHAGARAAEHGEGLAGGWGGRGGWGWGVGGAGCGRPRSPQVLELLECIPPLLLLLLACGLDHTLFTMLSIIQQHSFVQYSFHSEPHGAPQQPPHTPPPTSPTPQRPPPIPQAATTWPCR